MATLSIQQISRVGITPSYAACANAGDEFVNDGANTFIHIVGGAVERILTIATPGTVDDLAVTDRTVTIAINADYMIGPLPSGFYNDGTGKVQLTYDSETNLTIGIFKL